MGDRAYIITKGRSFKEVCLTKRVIDGLTHYNSSGFRESPKYHLRFVKALLIGLIGISKLAANELDEIVMEFIYGEWLFSHNYEKKANFNLIVYYCFFFLSQIYTKSD